MKLGDGDNYGGLKRIGWQIHVYGAAEAYLHTWFESRNVPLQVYPWTDAMQQAGLRENAMYLIRPDTYVALAELAPSVDAVERYFARLQIKP